MSALRMTNKFSVLNLLILYSRGEANEHNVFLWTGWRNC